MITAKNYAAQAERYLHGLANLPVFNLDEPVILSYADAIKKAQHFTMPDGGLIFDDGRKGIKDTEIRLPFPCITIEYYCSESAKNAEKSKKDGLSEFYALKRVILAQEFPVSDIGVVVGDIVDGDFFYESSHFIILSAFFSDGSSTFSPCHISWIVPSRWDRFDVSNMSPTPLDGNYAGKPLSAIFPFPFSKCVFSRAIIEEYKNPQDALQGGVDDSGYETRVFLEFIEALSCKNVEFATIQSEPTAAEAAKRAKKGKLPIYETKVLSLKTTETKSGIKTTGLRAGHASPRQHLRRGHIRRLESGNIWVNSCIVGDASRGVVHKSYEVVA
jgi:hypothetical protein